MLQDVDGAPAHRDDAALMLSLLSGRFPGPPPVESELFKTWIDALWDLPASAPEWAADAANLDKWTPHRFASRLSSSFRWRLPSSPRTRFAALSAQM